MAEPIEVQMARVRTAFRLLPADMAVAAKRGMKRHGAAFMRYFTKTQLSGRKSPTSGLERRTGDLARRGFQYVVKEEEGRLVLRVFSSVKYAALQEYGSAGLPGGVIKAKKSGGYLAIPVGPALTPAGVPRYQTPRQLSDMTPPLFTAKGKKSGKLFMGRVEQGQVRAYFLLRREVRVPPRMRLRERWKQRALRIVPILTKEADKVLGSKYKRA